MKTKRILITVLLATGLFFAFPISAAADMGPKPQITVIVQNPPNEEYYLDLLINGDAPDDGLYDNLRDDRSEYDEAKLSLLATYYEGGWYPGLVRGTFAPMWGTLTGDKDGDTMVHTFGYVGVPDDFKIIIVTPDNQITVSREIHRNTYQSSIIYNYATGEVSQRNMLLSYLLQFLMTCLPTLLIEGILLLLFRFSWRKNWKVFLCVNLGTQVLLTSVLGTLLFQKGLLVSYLIFVPLELFILLIETVAYSRLLREHSFKRRSAYAITANVASAIFGWFMLWYEFLAHSRLL